MSKATTITRGLAMADPYIVGWQEKELYLFPTDYASSLAQKAGLQWGSSIPAPVSTSSLPRETTPATTPSTGLSTGAKVGIAVGAPGAVVIGAVTIWMSMEQKKIEGRPTAEMAGQDEELAGRRWFLGGRWRSEVKTEEPVRELDSRMVHVVPGPPVELDATDRQLLGSTQE